MNTALEQFFAETDVYEELDSEEELEAHDRGRRKYARSASPVPPRAQPELFEDEETMHEMEIIPPNDSRKRIHRTKGNPFRWICSIVPTFRHPATGKPIKMSNQPGSGFIVGPRHILTAAHVLFPTTGPLKDQAPLSVEVSPGRNKNSTPYGSYTSTTYRVRPEWRSGGNNTFDARFDFAMIKVSNEIANTGLKYWGANGTSTHRYPISRNWLRGKVVNVGGYPRDKKPYTQWISHDVLDEPEPTRNGQRMKNVFRYKADTCTGQSGAPVWWWDGANDRYLVGIHTGACDFLDGCAAVNGTGCLPGNRRWSHNRGLLLSHEVDKQIKAWLK